MANIAITNYCNLKCPYCFAEDMKQAPPKNMSLGEYKEILNFIKGDSNRIGIIGGEPTLHPQLSEILKLTFQHCIQYNINGILFTNAINLAPYLPQLESMKDYIRVLINCNENNIYTPPQLSKFNTVIDMIAHSSNLEWVDIGCNIYLDKADYTHCWTAVKKLGLSTVRASITSPGGKYQIYHDKKQLYYALLKQTFMKFVEQAEQNNITINLDCNQIPICFFTEKEQQYINKHCNNFIKDDFHCEPPIDILMDSQAISCFGNYQPINYKNFNNIYELGNYFFFKINSDAINQNNTELCTKCELYQHQTCQGGCLAFSEMNR